MKVTRINHAAINVHGRWPETRDFYCDFLGIGTTPRPGMIDKAVGGCWLQLPNGQVHVIDAPYDGSVGSPIGPHISYYVADLDEAERELDARGLEIKRFGDGTGRILWVTDPADNTVEFQQDPEVA